MLGPVRALGRPGEQGGLALPLELMMKWAGGVEETQPHGPRGAELHGV